MTQLLAQTEVPGWFVSALGNSPWALMFGLMLWKVLGAWEGDRKRLDTQVEAIQAMQRAVQEMQVTNATMARTNERTVNTLERIEKRLDEVEKAHA
jgi:hypothetical protein